MKVSPLLGSASYLKCNNKLLCVNFGSLKDDACLVSAGDDTKLSKSISKKTGLEPIEVDVHKFANNETYVNVKGDVLGKDVYLLPANSNNPNDDLINTFLRADAVSRMGAKQIIAIMPNYPYARQERKVQDGEAISAKLVADLLRTSGVDKVITSDIHNVAICGFSDRKMPILNNSSMNDMKDKIIDEGLDVDNLVIVGPDVGALKRATSLAKAIGCDMAVISKSRSAHNVSQANFIVGDVKGKDCIIYDDIIDTAGTIKCAVKMLKDNGAKRVYICATHGLFNGNALQNLESAGVEKIFVSNSFQTPNPLPKKTEYVDLADSVIGEMKKITP